MGIQIQRALIITRGDQTAGRKDRKRRVVCKLLCAVLRIPHRGLCGLPLHANVKAFTSIEDQLLWQADDQTTAGEFLFHLDFFAARLDC